MYTRITKTGDRQYLQLVESFRNDRGQVRVRVMANLGRLDRLGPEKLDPLINGLNRALGRTENTSSEIIQEAGRAHGNVFALHELWCELGFQKALSRALRSSRREFDAEALIRAMVFNRLCESPKAQREPTHRTGPSRKDPEAYSPHRKSHIQRHQQNNTGAA